jgi:hydrogenase nickel incorporation protein HypA/HybF
MHEVSIMAEAIRMAVESAQAAGARRIIGLRLRVGKLSGAVPEAMEFAWDVVRQGTMAEGAWLKIESVAGTCWCAACQAEFECADFFVECPRCHNPSGDLRRGRELEIAVVELEPEDVLATTEHTKRHER